MSHYVGPRRRFVACSQSPHRHVVTSLGDDEAGNDPDIQDDGEAS